jgi:hypothetical protein
MMVRRFQWTMAFWGEQSVRGVDRRQTRDWDSLQKSLHTASLHMAADTLKKIVVLRAQAHEIRNVLRRWNPLHHKGR